MLSGLREKICIKQLIYHEYESSYLNFLQVLFQYFSFGFYRLYVTWKQFGIRLYSQAAKDIFFSNKAKISIIH